MTDGTNPSARVFEANLAVLVAEGNAELDQQQDEDSVKAYLAARERVDRANAEMRRAVEQVDEEMAPLQRKRKAVQATHSKRIKHAMVDLEAEEQDEKPIFVLWSLTSERRNVYHWSKSVLEQFVVLLVSIYRSQEHFDLCFDPAIRTVRDKKRCGSREETEALMKETLENALSSQPAYECRVAFDCTCHGATTYYKTRLEATAFSEQVLVAIATQGHRKPDIRHIEAVLLDSDEKIDTVESGLAWVVTECQNQADQKHI